MAWVDVNKNKTSPQLCVRVCAWLPLSFLSWGEMGKGKRRRRKTPANMQWGPKKYRMRTSPLPATMEPKANRNGTNRHDEGRPQPAILRSIPISAIKNKMKTKPRPATPQRGSKTDMPLPAPFQQFKGVSPKPRKRKQQKPNRDQNLKGETILQQPSPQKTIFKTIVAKKTIEIHGIPMTDSNSLKETKRGGGAHGPPRPLRETLLGTATPREPELPRHGNRPKRAKHNIGKKNRLDDP